MTIDFAAVMAAIHLVLCGKPRENVCLTFHQYLDLNRGKLDNNNKALIRFFISSSSFCKTGITDEGKLFYEAFLCKIRGSKPDKNKNNE